MEMQYDYPLLKMVFEHYSPQGTDFSNIKLYSCMHLLAPQCEMYKKFVAFGFLPENIVVLGKAYSSNIDIIDELRSIGIMVIQPEFIGKSFDIEHAENCKKIASLIEDSSKNIILDDGGYLIREASSKAIEFAVEQTSSGFRKLENESLNFPIYNVARSKTKLTQESPLVARLVYERIKTYIEGIQIKSPKILVIGLGPIGENIYQIFKSNNFDVQGFDIKTTKLDLISYIKSQQPDLIIGATGSQLFTIKDIETFEEGHTYHFISVSSSDREFPVVECRSGQGVHEDVVYKNYVFVNNGFPITFKGFKNELTPVEIEKTIALLMGSVLDGLATKHTSTGFVDIPTSLEELINC